MNGPAEIFSKVVTVFGSSQGKEGDPVYGEAYRLGKLLAQAGYTVCNGGYRGVMEASARGAKEAGGRTIGITTEEFTEARCNSWIDTEKRMTTWKGRLFALIEAGRGYVVCEGGTGTLVELACVWEMARKGLARAKPIVLLSPRWGEMVQFLRGWPEVGKDSSIEAAATPQEAVQILNAKIP